MREDGLGSYGRAWFQRLSASAGERRSAADAAPGHHPRHLDFLGAVDRQHAGDALAVRAVLPLLDQPRLSAHLVQRVTREFLETASRTLEGQGRELAWRTDPTTVVTADDASAPTGTITLLDGLATVAK